MIEYEIATDTVSLTVPEDGTSMPAYVARPQRPDPHAGIIVFQEAFGVNAHVRDVTERFARLGYTAIAPALFHRTDPTFEGSYTDFALVAPHMQALTEQGTVADIRGAHSWLMSPDAGQATDAVCVGYCLGGRTSFLAATSVSLKAAVSYYGGKMALDRTKEVACPILFFWGGKDTHIPMEQIRTLEDALIAAEKPYANVVFSEAGHGFFCDDRAAYHPESAREAWALTLAFLGAHAAP
jgi:carboxymethylenebutenolidase